LNTSLKKLISALYLYPIPIPYEHPYCNVCQGSCKKWWADTDFDCPEDPREFCDQFLPDTLAGMLLEQRARELEEDAEILWVDGKIDWATYKAAKELAEKLRRAAEIVEE